MKNIFILCLLLITSCSTKTGPEGLLTSYVNQRFNNGVEVDDFEKYFAGSLLDEMSQLSQSELEKINLVKGSKKPILKISYKRCNGPEECFLTYTLQYNTTASAAGSAAGVRVKIKKIARLKSVEEKWRIYDISDVKTHYDYKALNK